jgi:hypothetical protein
MAPDFLVDEIGHQAFDDDLAAIHDKDVIGEFAGDGEPLLLAVGKTSGRNLALAVETDDAENLIDATTASKPLGDWCCARISD